MHKRGYCRHAVSVRPSVCLSVTFVSCALTNKDIFEIFSPSGSQAILVFPYQTGWRYSDGNPPNGGVEYKVVWKNDDFWPISHCISETIIVKWAHAARQFGKHRILFPFMQHLAWLPPGASPGETTRSSAVAERPRDASCLSVVSFNIPTGRFFITSYCGFRFTCA